MKTPLEHVWLGAASLGVAVLLVAGSASLGIPRANAQPAKPLDGQSIAFDRGKGNCLTCHAIKGGDSPGTIGPPLVDMKSRFPDRKELVAVVTDETKRNPQTVMPPFGRNHILDPKEIEAVVDFLYSL